MGKHVKMTGTVAGDSGVLLADGCLNYEFRGHRVPCALTAREPRSRLWVRRVTGVMKMNRRIWHKETHEITAHDAK